MVDLSLLPGSLAATAKPEIARKIPLSIGRTSVDRASFHMQRLYWTNLEVRYRCIDEARCSRRKSRWSQSARRIAIRFRAKLAG